MKKDCHIKTAVLLIYMKSGFLIYATGFGAIHGRKSATPKQHISKIPAYFILCRNL